MRIEFSIELTSDTHFINTGVRFTSSFIELSEKGDSVVGKRAHRAYHALNAYYGFKQQELAVRKQFYEKWKRDNPE